jgi:hypothetical protein
MKDLRRPALLYLKAALLLAVGCISVFLLILRQPSVTTVVLIALALWAFARAYYFGFYVIERYIDPSFRFSGLWSVVKHLVRTRAGKQR